MASVTSFQKHRFHVLDGMRGIAALMVMLFHFYSRYSFPFLKNTFIAVDFFFILSGFVIYHAYGARITSGMTAAEYFASRVARLFPMAAVGLVLGFFPLLAITRSGHADYSNFDLSASMVSNLLMLPYLNSNSKSFGDHLSVTGQIFPADDPLWSIFAELFASVAFLWLIRMTNRRLVTFCAWSLVAFWLFSFVNGRLGGAPLFDPDMGWNTKSFIGIFPRVCFGFGCGVLLFRNRSALPGLKIIQSIENLPNIPPLAIYALLLGFLAFPLRLGGIYALLAISILAPLLVAVGSNSKMGSEGWISRLSQLLGWISFPVYCLHRPIIGLIGLLDGSSAILSSRHISIPLAAALITVALSAFIGWLFDHALVQRRLSTLLTGLFSYRFH